MTQRRRSPKEAAAIKQQLADIIQDTFDNNGQVITHDALAVEHVNRNKSRSADDDVARYGGVAVALLRKDKGYAIVPVTGLIATWTGNPANEEEVANTVAGLGAGGVRIGWYQPTGVDDWLWVFYIGHLTRSGAAAVFHAAQQVDAKPKLVSAKGHARLAQRTVDSLPVPAGKAEKKVLTATVNR